MAGMYVCMYLARILKLVLYVRTLYLICIIRTSIRFEPDKLCINYIIATVLIFFCTTVRVPCIIEHVQRHLVMMACMWVRSGQAKNLTRATNDLA